MIELVDQSEPDKLKFHCDRCGRTFTQANWSALDMHTPNPSQTALKAGIPPCQPLPETAKKAAKA